MQRLDLFVIAGWARVCVQRRVYTACVSDFRLPRTRCSWTLRTEPMGYPETSVRNFHYSLSNNPEESSPTRIQKDSWTLRIGPIGCPETCVRNFHYSLSNNPEESSPTRIKKDSWTLRMGPIGCPETSVRNFRYSLRNNPEESGPTRIQKDSWTLRIGCPKTSVINFHSFLLWLALQSTTGFNLLSDFLPFALSLHWFLHRLIPIICISSTISTIHLFLGLPLILVPIVFHSNIILGVLLSSIRITWPS